MIVLFITLVNLIQIIFWKILCLNFVGMYKTHTKEINIKNRVYNYYSDYLIRAKESEIKNVLIEKL